jgi:serine protease Do
MFCGGESGAPVFESDGELAGMMIASLPEMASSFVLPKRSISKIFNEITKNGFIRHPKIGIEVQSEYKFGVGQEIVISKIVAESEAEKAGLQVGDVVKKVGDFDVRYREDLCNAVFFCCHDGLFNITVVRGENELSFQVKSEYLVE